MLALVLGRAVAVEEDDSCDGFLAIPDGIAPLALSSPLLSPLGFAFAFMFGDSLDKRDDDDDEDKDEGLALEPGTPVTAFDDEAAALSNMVGVELPLSLPRPATAMPLVLGLTRPVTLGRADEAEDEAEDEGVVPLVGASPTARPFPVGTARRGEGKGNNHVIILNLPRECHTTHTRTNKCTADA